MSNKCKLLFLIISFLNFLYFCAFSNAQDKFFHLSEKWSVQLPASINAIKLYDINANNSQDIIIGTSATIHIASDSAREVITSSDYLPYGISCIDVGDLIQDNIPEILAGRWSALLRIYIFTDAEIDTYITVPDNFIYKYIVSLKTVPFEDSSVTFIGSFSENEIGTFGSVWRVTGYLENFISLFPAGIPEEMEFQDIDKDGISELLVGEFYHGSVGGFSTTYARIVISRIELPDSVTVLSSSLFYFEDLEASICGGGFSGLAVGNCDSDSSLEVVGSAFVDTSGSADDSCCIIVLSAVDGSTKAEQWRATYFGTDNIVGGIALVDFNNDGINEVLVAHQNAPMELLNGEDGSKIAESDSSFTVGQFAFGDVDGDDEGEVVIGNGNVLRVFEVDFTTDVPEEDKDLSQRNFTILSQNYPNPFNYTTLIRFEVNSSQPTVNSPILTTLKIYNILGQKVRTLLDEEKIPGNYQTIWDGRDEEGNIVPSGIYFYQLTVGKYSESKKMLFLK